MNTECNKTQLEFHSLKRRQVTGRFDGSAHAHPVRHPSIVHPPSGVPPSGVGPKHPVDYTR